MPSSFASTLIGNKRFVWGKRTYIMGIINVTPDSFSGDGLGKDLDAAVQRALQFEDLGADIIDVGGEASRPASIYGDSKPLSLREELDRVIPVIEALASQLQVPVSIDTYESRVAEEALAAGAAMINDIWGFTRDPDMAGVAAGARVPVVLMHNQSHTHYDNVVPDIIKAMQRLIEDAVKAGVDLENIILDPGLGFFGKTHEHNLEILRRLDEFRVLQRPLLVGTSRKTIIVGRVLNLPVDELVEGTAATVALSIAKGVDVVRVHDVREMVRVARMSDAIVRGWSQRDSSSNLLE